MPARVDPYKNTNFLVEIDGLSQANFAECSGLSSSVDVIEYREGGDRDGAEDEGDHQPPERSSRGQSRPRREAPTGAGARVVLPVRQRADRSGVRELVELRQKGHA